MSPRVGVHPAPRRSSAVRRQLQCAPPRAVGQRKSAWTSRGPGCVGRSKATHTLQSVRTDMGCSWRGRSSREHSGLLYIHRPPPCRAVHPFTFRPPFHLRTARAGRPGRSARRKESLVHSGEDWWARQLFFKAKTGHVRGGMHGSERARARGSGGARARQAFTARAHQGDVQPSCEGEILYTQTKIGTCVYSTFAV